MTISMHYLSVLRYLKPSTMVASPNLLVLKWVWHTKVDRRKEAKENFVRVYFRYWGEPERAPHKWCIESKSLHSDGTTYVRRYVTLIVSAMVSSYTRLLSYL